MHWQHTAGLTSSLLEPHRAPADAHTPQAELRLPGGSPRARSSDAQQASQPASCQACSGSSQPEQHRDPPECRASATAAAVPNTDMVRDTESQPTSEAADAACGARGSAAASPASEIGRPSHLVPPSVPQLSNSHAARQGPSDPAQQGPPDPMQEGPTDPALTCSPAACTRAGSRGLSQVGVGCHSCWNASCRQCPACCCTGVPASWTACCSSCWSCGLQVHANTPCMLRHWHAVATLRDCCCAGRRAETQERGVHQPGQAAQAPGEHLQLVSTYVRLKCGLHHPDVWQET